jgi:hypothetical protein
MMSNLQKCLVCLALAGCFILTPVGAQQSAPAASPAPSTPKVQSASAHTGKTTSSRRPSLSPHHRKHSRGTRHRSSRGRRKKGTTASSQGQ